MNAQQIIDGLEDLYAQREFLSAEKSKLLEAAIPAEVKAIIADIEEEFEGKQSAVNSQISEVETTAKDLVIQEGATVNGNLIQAVYSKARINRDNKVIDGIPGAMAEAINKSVVRMAEYDLSPEAKTIVISELNNLYNMVTDRLKQSLKPGNPSVSFRRLGK